MRRGRKPTPTALNVINGTYDKDPQRRRDNEPDAPTEKPSCPDHLDEFAKCEWFHITTLLDQMGYLSSADERALEVYCEAYSQWRVAVDNVRKYGQMLTQKDKAGNVRVLRNPADKIRAEMATQLYRMLVEFGLTPSSRSRIHVQKKPEDALAKFVG